MKLKMGKNRVGNDFKKNNLQYQYFLGWNRHRQGQKLGECKFLVSKHINL